LKERLKSDRRVVEREIERVIGVIERVIEE
jgi:hypothetical protein